MGRKEKMTPERHAKLAGKYNARASELQKKLDKAKHFADVHQYKADHPRTRAKR